MKVEFHSGVDEPLAHTCRLLRKAHAAGARVVVQGPAQVLDQLDALLWSFDALSFVPHLRLRAGARPTPLQARTPAWLVDDVASVDERQVLIHLGDENVDGWEAFARVIEVVQADAAAAVAARQRWRRYGEQPGVDLVHHARASSA